MECHKYFEPEYKDTVDGHKKLFKDACQAFMDDCYHYAFSILKDKFDAEDATQDALEKLCRLSKPILYERYCTGNTEALKNYMIKTVYTTCMDHFAKKKKNKNATPHIKHKFNTTDINLDLANLDNWNTLLFNDEQLRIFNNLPKIQRDVVELKGLGYKDKEIGHKLNISESAARKRVYEASKKLRNVL